MLFKLIMNCGLKSDNVLCPDKIYHFDILQSWVKCHQVNISKVNVLIWWRGMDSVPVFRVVISRRSFCSKKKRFVKGQTFNVETLHQDITCKILKVIWFIPLISTRIITASTMSRFSSKLHDTHCEFTFSWQTSSSNTTAKLSHKTCSWSSVGTLCTSTSKVTAKKKLTRII